MSTHEILAAANKKLLLAPDDGDCAGDRARSIHHLIQSAPAPAVSQEELVDPAVVEVVKEEVDLAVKEEVDLDLAVKEEVDPAVPVAPQADPAVPVAPQADPPVPVASQADPPVQVAVPAVPVAVPAVPVAVPAVPVAVPAVPVAVPAVPVAPSPLLVDLPLPERIMLEELIVMEKKGKVSSQVRRAFYPYVEDDGTFVSASAMEGIKGDQAGHGSSKTFEDFVKLFK